MEAMTHPSYEFQDNCLRVTLTLKLQINNGKPTKNRTSSKMCARVTPAGCLRKMTGLGKAELKWINVFSGILNKKPFVIVTKKMIINSVGIKYIIYSGSPFPRFLLTANRL